MEIEERINTIISAGSKLVEIMDEEKPMPDRNLIIYAFVRKTVRLLSALRILIAAGYEEEAQILVRALVETRINCEYFLTIAAEDYQSATGRVVASLMLDKLKALRATNFMIGDRQIDKKYWEGIEQEIKDSCGEIIFAQIKSSGFSGLSLEARAARTGNKEIYDLVYRLYSRNAHALDIHEQLGRKLTGGAPAPTEQTLLPAVLAAAWDSGGAVVDKCNDWLSDPLRVKETKSTGAK